MSSTAGWGDDDGGGGDGDGDPPDNRGLGERPARTANADDLV